MTPFYRLMVATAAIFGEKKNITHQAPHRFFWDQFVETVDRSLRQKKKSGDRSRTVLTRLG